MKIKLLAAVIASLSTGLIGQIALETQETYGTAKTQ